MLELDSSAGGKKATATTVFRKLETKNYPLVYIFSLNLWLFWNNATLKMVTVLKYNMELELKRKRSGGGNARKKWSPGQSFICQVFLEWVYQIMNSCK